MRKFWNLWLKSNKPGFFALFLISMLGCFSCNQLSWDDEEENKELIARVKDSYLYENDIKKVFNNKSISKSDSVALRKKYINDWIRQKLIFYKALENLPEEKKNKEEALQEYYESLIRYEYEQALIHQKLDTVISQDTIEQFYNSHPNRFKLQQNLIKFKYIIVPQDAPNQEKIDNWFRAEENYYLDSLYHYSGLYAHSANLKDDQWYYYNQVREKLHLPKKNQERFLNQNSVYKTRVNNLTYFVHITDYRTKNERAPLSFKRETIKNMILNRKKIELIESMEKEVLQNGLEKNYVQRYD